jgi:single-strand DNA-binding protein
MNRVVLIGNLTKDPELKTLQSGQTVCNLRIAVNDRVKSGDDWIDKPGYYTVEVWGKQGENAAKYLSKGSPVALDGKLRWREWETSDGSKREAITINANTVQFLSSGERRESASSYDAASAAPVQTGGAAAAYDDDIPY